MNIEQYEYMTGPQSDAGIKVCQLFRFIKCLLNNTIK